MISQLAVCALLLHSRLAAANLCMSRDWVGKALGPSSAMAASRSFRWVYLVIVDFHVCARHAKPDALAACHVAGIHVEGGGRDAVSPVVHIRLAEQPKDSCEGEAALQQVVSTALRKSWVLLCVNRMSKLYAVKCGPSIRWEARLSSVPA